MKPAFIPCISVAGSEGSKPSTKQSIRPVEVATVHDIRLQQLQDLAASDDPDVAEIAKADIFREFGDRGNGK